MGDIVNLRAARKRRDRDEKARLADENRVRHGRTKGEKQRDRAEAGRLDAHVEARRRDPKATE
ncbi:DUF4169 family protein [Mesorhizobium sp. IMUNJ 23232]|uniref:DUF4169 family protein n=1 Tax=Mesorhizobium sp. IMUNJ 23232 TaxID=3376064 RepID=UPI003796BDC1